jgi:hypothetical protein
VRKVWIHPEGRVPEEDGDVACGIDPGGPAKRDGHDGVQKQIELVDI